MTSTQVLAGLQPEPLASYLAGLGLIRVLGEQADPSATATWTDGGLSICSSVPDIAAWLADEYVPTPVLSPWNGGSGFGAKDKEPIRRLKRLREHPSPRLTPLREAIAVAEKVVATARRRGWITDEKVVNKAAVVLELRNQCPDGMLPWIDASIVLTGEETYFPPILGTGGNDGRLDFSTNYHEQVMEIIGATDKQRARSLASARDLLSGAQTEQLTGAPIGQFDPGNAGGPGSSGYGSADSLANPWSYVLTVEGALLFAASVTRRNQQGAGRAAMSFTVAPSPDGSDSGAAGEESRGEVWVPIWTKDFSLNEIRQLFAEARASWRGRPARRAVDFYAATRSLGVARGIDEFGRYALQRRNGLAFTAVPIDRVLVREQPSVSLAAKVEDWTARVGHSDASVSVSEALRGFRKRHLEFARDGGPWPLARMLAALTTLEMAVARSVRARDAVPVRYAPPAGNFLPVLAGIGSRELRVAVGIASCAARPVGDHGKSMRQILLPVEQGAWRDAALVPGFAVRPVHDVLADVLIWRSRTAATEREAHRFRGIPSFRIGIPVPAADLHAFASGDQSDFNDRDLDLLLRACLALDWRDVSWPWTAERPDVPVTTLALLHPLAAGLKPGSGLDGTDDEPIPALSPEWAVRLAADHVRLVHQEAESRLRQAGWTAVSAPPARSAGNGKRIAAALIPRCIEARKVLRMSAFETKSLTEELS